MDEESGVALGIILMGTRGYKKIHGVRRGKTEYKSWLNQVSRNSETRDFDH